MKSLIKEHNLLQKNVWTVMAMCNLNDTIENKMK